MMGLAYIRAEARDAFVLISDIAGGFLLLATNWDRNRYNDSVRTGP